jgi:hypothetical protein
MSIQREILATAKASWRKVASLAQEKNAFAFFHDLKFEKVGFDPLDNQRALNFIEQLNQTFTCLATIKAAERLLGMHPDGLPFRLNLATSKGSDIVSMDGSVAAEVFTATSPYSNNKLDKDAAKIGMHPATHKYVFWYCPNFKGQVPGKIHDIHILRLDSVLILRPLPSFDMGPAFGGHR